MSRVVHGKVSMNCHKASRATQRQAMPNASMPGRNPCGCDSLPRTADHHPNFDRVGVQALCVALRGVDLDVLVASADLLGRKLKRDPNGPQKWTETAVLDAYIALCRTWCITLTTDGLLKLKGPASSLRGQLMQAARSDPLGARNRLGPVDREAVRKEVERLWDKPLPPRRRRDGSNATLTTTADLLRSPARKLGRVTTRRECGTVGLGSAWYAISRRWSVAVLAARPDLSHSWLPGFWPLVAPSEHHGSKIGPKINWYPEILASRRGFEPLLPP